MPGTLADGAAEYRRRHPRPDADDQAADLPADTPRERLDRGAALYRERRGNAAKEAS